MRLHLVSCDVFRPEVTALLPRCPHELSVVYESKGLHDTPAATMSARVQELVDAAPAGCDAILLGYGFCNRGVAGVTARTCPLILPRAHDCMTLFLGSRKRYEDYFFAHPGTYFKTNGWMTGGEPNAQLRPDSIRAKNGYDRPLEDLIAEYGEDNGRYLFETFSNATQHYGRIAFIDMGVVPDDPCERTARDEATAKGWSFETVPGDLSLLARFLNGPWDAADFLTIPPGSAIAADSGEGLVHAVLVRPGANA